MTIFDSSKHPIYSKTRPLLFEKHMPPGDRTVDLKLLYPAAFLKSEDVNTSSININICNSFKIPNLLNETVMDD